MRERNMTVDLATADATTFEPNVGQVFEVQTESGAVALVLDNIKVFTGSTIRDNQLVVDGREIPPRQAFALTFEGPREPVLAPQNYVFRHPELGEWSMFLSAFRQDMTCMLYESVLN